MSDPLNSLEAQRGKILRQFLSLSDLRPGSISAVVHRCGKSYCHCAKPKDPGHEPQIRVLRKVHGKSVAETLSSPAAFRKAQGEVSEFHRFQELSAELVPINEPPDTRIRHGTLRLIILPARQKTCTSELDAVEMSLRAALQQAGAAGLSQLLRQEPPAEPHVLCSCGGQARYKGMRPKPLLTVLGRAGNAARLLLVLSLSARAILHRRRAGCAEHRTLSRGAPHVEAGGQ
jgi:hypothetical protein